MDVNLIHQIARALAVPDTELAAELRSQLYRQHPHTSRHELNLAITNDFLDIITPSSPLEPALDAHLDDIGD